MAEGMTLWERLTKKVVSLEEQIYNPLKARIGGSVTFDLPDLRDYIFFVHEIRETVRKPDSTVVLQFADYVLLARQTAEPVWMRLRVSETTPSEFSVLLLSWYDEYGFTQAQENGLDKTVHTSTLFEVTDHDTGNIEEYNRIGGIKVAEECTVTSIKDKKEVTYVDQFSYSRWTKDLDGGPEYEQFLFVEQDKDSGEYKIWRGQEVNQSRVHYI